MEDSPPPSPGNHIVQANPQIAAALAVSPMHQPSNEPNNGQFVNQPMGMGGGPAGGGGGGGGPIRMGPPPMQHQVRPMPYPPPQMRQGPPGGPPNFPMGQQQFQPNHQMRPQMQNQGMNMGGPGPSHPMGMGQHIQGPPQFQQNQMVLPPQMGHMPPPQQNPMTIQSSGPLGAIMDKSKLDDLMAQISSTTVLEESVKDVLVEYADDFVSGIIDRACRMLRNRDVKKIEGRDIEFILKNIYNMPVVPRSATHIFGVQSDMVDTSRDRHVPTEAHKQRVALLKRQIKKV